MNPSELFWDINSNKQIGLPILLDRLQSLVDPEVSYGKIFAAELFDMDLLNEIRSAITLQSTWVGFGNSLRDLKCVIQDEQALRRHQVFLKCRGPKKLVIYSTNLPHSPILNNEYASIEDVVSTLKKYINDLALFFYELEQIDTMCTVLEPLNPTFKDDYRRILLDERTWLHVEVRPDGTATNIHLVGQSDYWNDKLQEGLITWDHDKNIVENIMSVFDIADFPVPGGKVSMAFPKCNPPVEALVCSICLCTELPDNPAIPQPLCQNALCGMYFHRNCLFQWLVACAGNRPPAFGVITGSCPACLQPISCSEKDN